MELKGKNLLITGIGGSTGLRIAELALAKGMNVSGIELAEKEASKAEQAGFTVHRGDFTSEEVLKSALKGIHIVIHTAALFREGGNPEDFKRINSEGPLLVAKAAEHAGVSVFVQLSSALVYGFDFKDGIDEDAVLNPVGNLYCDSRIEAERSLKEYALRSRLKLIVIRPGDIFGPRSISFVERPISLMLEGKALLPNGGNGKLNPIYVDNLAHGIFLAIKKEKYGETLNLTDGTTITCFEYFSRLKAMIPESKESGIIIIPSYIPAILLEWGIQIHNDILSLFNQTPFLYPDAIDFMMRPNRYSNEKAVKELGYEPLVDFEEGMKRIELSLRDRWSNEV